MEKERTTSNGESQDPRPLLERGQAWALIGLLAATLAALVVNVFAMQGTQHDLVHWWGGLDPEARASLRQEGRLAGRDLAEEVNREKEASFEEKDREQARRAEEAAQEDAQRAGGQNEGGQNAEGQNAEGQVDGGQTEGGRRSKDELRP